MQYVFDDTFTEGERASIQSALHQLNAAVGDAATEQEPHERWTIFRRSVSGEEIPDPFTVVAQNTDVEIQGRSVSDLCEQIHKTTNALRSVRQRTKIGDE